LKVTAVGRSGIGQYQAHLEILAITVAKCREGAGPQWSPPALSLAFKSRERLPPTDLFANTRITLGAGETSLTIPRAILELPLAPQVGLPGDHCHTLAQRPLPGDLGGMVQLQVEALLSDPSLTIDAVARSLGWSTRSLQRHLALHGITFSQLMSEIRLRQSRLLLEQTEKPILEIAMELGYSDASNFTRAFRRQMGVSPWAFRDASKTA
jgi:AraC-like DNA-binding protein